MSRLFTLLFLAAACTGARAQSPQPQPQGEPHGLAVVKFGWERRALNWQGDYFGRINETPDETSARAARNALRSKEARRAVFQVEANRMERAPGVNELNAGRAPDRTEPPRFAFLYKAT